MHWQGEEGWKHTSVVWRGLWDRLSKVSCHCETGFWGPGAPCHCSEHLGIMYIREVNEDREGLCLHPVTDPNHLSVCVHVWERVQLEDNAPTATSAYCWRLFLPQHPAYLADSAHKLESARQPVLSLPACFTQGSSTSTLKEAQQGRKFHNR